MAQFSTLKSVRQRTTFTTHPTTFSPQKTIHEHALFLKHPQKAQQKQQNPGFHQGLTFSEKIVRT
jgi:hypothetical protein